MTSVGAGASAGQPAGEAGLLEPGLGDPRIRALVTEAAYVDEVLAFEGALARASAAAGVVPVAAAEAIARAAVLSSVDVATLAARAGLTGSPVVPIVQDLCAAAGPEGSGWAHFGATSQDAWDTATAVVAKRVLALILPALERAGARAAGLARDEARTLMLGRTLGQPAGPYSFGLKAAGWCTALAEASSLLDSAGASLAVQLGGATGTLASFDGHGAEVRRQIADALGLADVALPWHTNRVVIAELAAALGVTAGAWSKIAIDVILLAQHEVGEVREGGDGRGGSSAMPHKQNPSRAIEVRAGALRVPGLVATVLSVMGQELERGAGTWQAEWAPLRELLKTVGGIVLLGEALLASLELDRERMGHNFAALRGLPLSETLANALSPHLGRLEAQRVVRELAAVVRERGITLAEAASAHERVRACCSDERLRALFDAASVPEAWVELVEQALAAVVARRAQAGPTADDKALRARGG